MSYSEKNNDAFIKEFIEHYGAENIPDPTQYPRCFEFLVKSYRYYKQMEELKGTKND